MRTRAFDIVTFDCYGTLIDWETGIASAFAAAARGGSAHVSGEDLVSAYAESEAAVEAQAYRPYRNVLAESARRTGERLGLKISPEEGDFLARSLPAWLPFSDTNPALERLCESGLRLGILSNVDDDLLAETCRHFSVRFDLVVTAQQVRSYKPAFAHFEEARRRLGGQRWIHAAQSHFHDVVPARELGIPIAWINRKRQKPERGICPDLEFHTLLELAEGLGA